MTQHKWLVFWTVYGNVTDGLIDERLELFPTETEARDYYRMLEANDPEVLHAGYAEIKEQTQ